VAQNEACATSFLTTHRSQCDEKERAFREKKKENRTTDDAATQAGAAGRGFGEIEGLMGQ